MTMRTLSAAALAAAVMALTATSASATPFTENSPTGGALPAGFSAVGGIVVDMLGTSGNRLVSQLAASSLFEGFSDSGTPAAFEGNPLTIGIQTGFDASTLSVLGGGITAMSIRFTLDDGDSAPGDFDDGADNTLLLNGLDFGLWSAVPTERTSSDGATALSTTTGFGDSILSTGWFSSTDLALLSSFYATLESTGEIVFGLLDVDPGDNFYDFTQGIDASLIGVGTGPTVTPGGGSSGGSQVSEPGVLALLGLGLVGLAVARRRV